MDNTAVQVKDVSTCRLVDQSWEVLDNLKKSGVLIQELTEEYFVYSRDKEKDHDYIIFEHHRSGLLARMLLDYIEIATEATRVLQDDLKLHHEATRPGLAGEPPTWKLINRDSFNTFSVEDMTEFRNTFFPHLSLDQIWGIR